ncbi:hypothetical protein E4U57_000216 [Claviceps arundinis]|uniref:Sucrose transporter n=1 Tax=Claviceps arundinis TaxID=1623583 RepID=A0ABQ7PDI3_9HYPO|nr:hypothetical protein E4U57_000216 [Claviceps arundinis]
MESDSDSNIELEPWNSEAKLSAASTSLSRIRQSVYFLPLTIGLSGLQAVFALVFSNGSAYLSSLEIDGPVLSLVWSVGPICGLILQPCFGILSDRCQSSWGRRKPFIFFGALGSVASLLSLASAEVLGNGIARMISPSQLPDIEERNTLPAILAIISIVTLNISVQALQCGLRAIIVDTVRPRQQQTANAWAGVLVSLTNVLCYGLSFSNLRRGLGSEISSQFAILCVITSAILAITVAVTCLTVREDRDGTILEIYTRDDGRRNFIKSTLFDLCAGFSRLAPGIHKASDVSRTNSEDHPHTESQFSASQIGSLGLLIFSSISLVTGVAVPHFTAHGSAVSARNSRDDREHAIRRLWAASQLLFATSMLLTYLVTSVGQAFFLVGLSGISWAVTIWAPHAIIGAYASTGMSLTRAERLLAVAEDSFEIRSGIIVGLHNAAVSAPQIVSAVCCSFLFWALDGVSADIIGWAFRMAAISAFAAAWLIANSED